MYPDNLDSRVSEEKIHFRNGKESGKHTNTTMTESVFKSMASGVMSLMKGGSSEQATQEKIRDIVAQVRDSTDQGELHDSTSINEIHETMKAYSGLIKEVAKKYVADVEFSKITPMSLLYYLEHEDERKNPSWRNRVHRFCPSIDIDKVEELYHALVLAFLSYADTADEIRETLLKGHSPAELVYCDAKSEPGEPAHFIAVKLDQPTSSRAPLEVIIGVRGTKSVSDAITDILCDSEEYRGGKAHQFIVKGGKYLFEKHKALLEDLAGKAGRSKIKLTLVGHSLGAGAASIAGIEFNELRNFDVDVYGFGCPAVLSKELAEKATFITTVVNDSDAIPRTSAATITNLLLNLVVSSASRVRKFNSAAISIID
jgi:hypothetical protein